MADEDEDLFVPPDAEQPQAPEPDAPAPEPDEPDDDVEIGFEGEAPPEAAAPADSDLIRKLRAEIRTRDQRLSTLERASQPKPVEVGPEPTMEACNYEEDKFKAEWIAWSDRKAKGDADAAKAKKAEEDRAAAWAKEMQTYDTRKVALGVRDFDAAEDTVTATLSQAQQAVILQAAADPAKVIYALGKHPDKLASLAGTDNLIKFAVAIAKLEGTITVNSKRRAPEPEGTLTGSARVAPGNDLNLAKMEAEADKDPNYDRGKIKRYLASKSATRVGRRPGLTR